MGKKSKKMIKNQQKAVAAENEMQLERAHKELAEKMEQEKYDEALGVVAEMIKAKCQDPEMMYQAAFCYFMTGDYERAASWLNNTLSYAPAHVRARILLARLCILEERTDDGLAVFDFILEHWQSGLTVEEKETMEDVLEYYGRNEAAKLQQDYPHIAAFLNITAESVAVAAESDQPMAAGASGASVADQLRALLEDHPEENEQVVEAAAPAEEQNGTAETTRMLQEIKQRKISIREKIKILNDFAGSFYYQDDLSAAQEFLQEALHLDAQDSDTLRNLAYVYAAMGNKDMALDCAGKMEVADFSLLTHLKNM